MKFKAYIENENELLTEGKMMRVLQGLNKIGLTLEFNDQQKPEKYKNLPSSKIRHWDVRANSLGTEISVRPKGEIMKITGNSPVMTQLNADKMTGLSKALADAATEFEFIRSILEPISKGDWY